MVLRLSWLAQQRGATGATGERETVNARLVSGIGEMWCPGAQEEGWPGLQVAPSFLGEAGWAPGYRGQERVGSLSSDCFDFLQ